MTFISSFSTFPILDTGNSPFGAGDPHTGARRSGRFADLAERLMPAVVNISTSQTVDTSATPPGQPPFNDFFEEFFRQRQDPQAQADAKCRRLVRACD